MILPQSAQDGKSDIDVSEKVQVADIVMMAWWFSACEVRFKTLFLVMGHFELNTKRTLLVGM